MQFITAVAITAVAAVVCPGPLWAQESTQPNILVIWGDDIGQSNISAYTFGLMGYQTPNIDRIADEGMMFTDYYGEQSCTAGRSSFIMGQSVFRTGLSKVGLPGAEEGMQIEDPTIAGLLKAEGYATGQFGKNHLGDRDEHLPTNHGFDEFFGNLYHLNAEEEPENEDYPRDMVLPSGETFLERFGPRGVIRSTAPTARTGSPSRSRIPARSPSRARKSSTTRPPTPPSPSSRRRPPRARPGSSGGRARGCTSAPMSGTRCALANEIAGRHLDEYQAGMIEHDMHIGQFLDKLDELGIADNTIVFYSTDNGPHMNTWPDAGMTPFWGEKNTNWEGAWRVPAMVRWPGRIPEGEVTNEIVHHMDWLPTFLAAAGNETVKEDLLDGVTVDEMAGRDYRVHLDGYNILPLLTGETDESPRKEIFYFTDDGDLAACGIGLEDHLPRAKGMGHPAAWIEPLTPLRMPLIFNLRRDPYERGYRTSNTYYDWMLDRAFMLVPAQPYVGQFLATFQEYPPRQEAASFSLDKVMEKLSQPGGTQ